MLSLFISILILWFWCCGFFCVVWQCKYYVSLAEPLHSALMKIRPRKRRRLRTKPLKHRRNLSWSTAPQSKPRLLKHSSARALTLLLCAPLLPWSVRTGQMWPLWATATASGPTAARSRRSTSHSCTNTPTRMEMWRRLLTVRLASNVCGCIALDLFYICIVCAFCR